MNERPSRSVLLGLSVPPLAWAFQGLLTWCLDWQACPYGSACAPSGRLRGVEIGATLLFLGISAACFIANVQPLRHRAAVDVPLDQVTNRSDFMRLAGLLVSMMFTLGIACAGIPILLLGPCARVR